MTDTASQLRESFELLQREVPDVVPRIVAALGAARVHIEVDEERFAVQVEGGQPLVTADSVGGSPRIITHRRTILDVLDARSTLEEAVNDGILVAVGELEELQQLHAALMAYVHGGVRAPSFPNLLSRFRNQE